MTYAEIHVWGDSLARGIIYNEEKGRYAISPERWTARLETTAGCKVFNHSNMGATVLDGLSSFQKFVPVPSALCAIEFGGNDCDLNWAEVAAHPLSAVKAKVPLDTYISKLTEFVLKVRDSGMQPLLITPLPLHSQRYFDWVTKDLNKDHVLTALGDVNGIYRWQERYAIAMRNVACTLKCRLLDLRDLFLAQPNYEKLMCVDGIHPNNEGHRLISTAVAEDCTPCSSVRGASADFYSLDPSMSALCTDGVG